MEMPGVGAEVYPCFRRSGGCSIFAIHVEFMSACRSLDLCHSRRPLERQRRYCLAYRYFPACCISVGSFIRFTAVCEQQQPRRIYTGAAPNMDSYDRSAIVSAIFFSPVSEPGTLRLALYRHGRLWLTFLYH